MRRSLLALLVAYAALALVGPVSARAATPPDRDDPCARAARDVCHTAGTGMYAESRYGARWLGDYRGAVPGAAATFCIDLRFWYAARRYRYVETSAAALRNRDGEPVSLVRREKLAYAIWQYGRSSSPSQQAAVSLYVHALMGDGRPGELDPRLAGSTGSRLYRRIAAAAARRHGPYRIETGVSGSPVVGEPAAVTIRVVSAAGYPLPHVPLTLTAGAAADVVRRVSTDASGVARVSLTPTGPRTLLAVTTRLASPVPRLYAATARAAAANAQRLAVPTSRQVARTLAVPARTRLALSAVAAPERVAVGETTSARVTLAGAAPGWRGQVAVSLYGPFRSLDALRCDRAALWQGSLPASGSGTLATSAVTMNRPGWYAYRALVPGGAGVVGAATRCGVRTQEVLVEARPQLAAAVSAPAVPAGATVFDRLFVAGLSGERSSGSAALYGPFTAREAISCDVPIWSGPIATERDGEILTPPVSLPQPGYYVYTVRLSGGAFVRGTQTSCDDDAQTTRALAPLRLTARANAAVVRVGTDVSATLTVQGAATTAAQVRAELWGPFATPSAIRCVGSPSWSGTLPLANGAQRTPPVRVSAPGYYAFRATTAPDATHGGAATPCGDRAATTHVTLPPAAAVRIAVDVVRARSKVATVLRLTGTRSPTTSVAIDVFGPFGSRAAVRCAGARSWEGHVVVGTQPTARITAPVGKPGFYAIGARVSDSGGDLGSVPGPSCSRSRSRVILAAPRIITGGRILSSGAAAAAARVGAPTRVRIASPAIDARVYPVAIDTRNGVLAVPASLSRAGWWRDGAAPGARSGAVLIAAHVDSARGGEGAFFRLHRVRPGEQVQLSTAGGAAVAYRVVSVRSYRKDALPTGIYSHGGAPRLVLVTCGGPFDRASGRYRDNIVVTAVPVEATPSRARGSAAARR